MNTKLPNQMKAQEAQKTSDPVKGLLQRKCACGQHTIAGGECESCGKQKLQRRAVGHAVLPEAPPVVHDVLRSPGQPLDTQTRAFLEPRFGHDFSHVRVHADAQAAESAQAVNALAYTVGRDVVLGAGQYAPRTNVGLRTLAHELAHVVQQGGSSRRVQPKRQPGATSVGDKHSEEQVAGQAGFSGGTLHIGQPGDSYEREADAVAEAVMSTAEPRFSRGDSPSGLVQRLTTPLLQRSLIVNPRDVVPPPRGQAGPPELLTDAVQRLVNDTCPTGGFTVNATTGVVTSSRNSFCVSHPPRPPGVTDAQVSPTPAGCTCLCDVVTHARTTTVAYHRGGPGTTPVGPTGTGPGSPTVGIDPTFQGQYRINGVWVNVPFHLLFSHEICGHALPLMRGTQVARGPAPPGGTPPEELHSVDVERRIAAEHNPPLPRRPDDYSGAARERP